MLFIVPLFKILTKKEKKTGFYIRVSVDNSLLIYKAKNKTLQILKVHIIFYKIKVYAEANSIVSDSKKFETIYFS